MPTPNKTALFISLPSILAGSSYIIRASPAEELDFFEVELFELDDLEEAFFEVEVAGATATLGAAGVGVADHCHTPPTNTQEMSGLAFS